MGPQCHWALKLEPLYACAVKQPSLHIFITANNRKVAGLKMMAAYHHFRSFGDVVHTASKFMGNNRNLLFLLHPCFCCCDKSDAVFEISHYCSALWVAWHHLHNLTDQVNTGAHFCDVWISFFLKENAKYLIVVPLWLSGATRIFFFFFCINAGVTAPV